MRKVEKNASAVTQLLAQIEIEYCAAQQGLSGLAVGATHAAITARMENIGKIHEHLQTIVGEEATRLVVECLENITVEERNTNVIG